MSDNKIHEKSLLEPIDFKQREINSIIYWRYQFSGKGTEQFGSMVIMHNLLLIYHVMLLQTKM